MNVVAQNRTAFIVFHVVAKNEDIVDAVKLFFREESSRGRITWTVDVLGSTLPSGGSWLSGALNAIKRADLVVVIAGEISNNVVFELGIAYALTKEMILLAPRGAALDIGRDLSDIAGVKLATYDPERIFKIPDILRAELDALKQARANQAAAALSPDYLVALGDVLQLEGLYDEAITKYQAAVDLDPANVRLLVRLGQAYVANYQLERAERVLREAVAVDRHSAMAIDALGQCLLDGGQYQKAIDECYVPLTRLYPTTDVYYYKIAVGYTELQQPDKAADFLAEAVAKVTDHPGVYYDLAWTSMRAARSAAGDERWRWIQGAIEALRNAIALDPDYRRRAAEDQDFETIRGEPQFQALFQ